MFGTQKIKFSLLTNLILLMMIQLWFSTQSFDYFVKLKRLVNKMYRNMTDLVLLYKLQNLNF